MSTQTTGLSVAIRSQAFRERRSGEADGVSNCWQGRSLDLIGAVSFLTMATAARSGSLGDDIDVTERKRVD